MDLLFAGELVPREGLLFSKMPPGTRNIYGFAFFNALSFQIILGSPMVLFAQAIGASSTVLGAIAGMTPLLVILQIPAARFGCSSSLWWRLFLCFRNGWIPRCSFRWS